MSKTLGGKIPPTLMSWRMYRKGTVVFLVSLPPSYLDLIWTDCVWISCRHLWLFLSSEYKKLGIKKLLNQLEWSVFTFPVGRLINHCISATWHSLTLAKHILCVNNSKTWIMCLVSMPYSLLPDHSDLMWVSWCIQSSQWKYTLLIFSETITGWLKKTVNKFYFPDLECGLGCLQLKLPNKSKSWVLLWILGKNVLSPFLKVF